MVPASMLGLLLFSWTGVAVVLLSVVHVVVCIFLLAVVLLQRGRTGDVMSAFGGPTPSSYAAMSTDDLLTRLTKIGAATFMITSLSLALLAARTEQSVIGDEPDATPAEASAPADASAPVTTAPVDGTLTPAETAPTELTPAETAPAPVEGEPLPTETPVPAETAPEGASAP